MPNEPTTRMHTVRPDTFSIFTYPSFCPRPVPLLWQALIVRRDAGRGGAVEQRMARPRNNACFFSCIAYFAVTYACDFALLTRPPFSAANFSLVYLGGIIYLLVQKALPKKRQIICCGIVGCTNKFKTHNIVSCYLLIFVCSIFYMKTLAMLQHRNSSMSTPHDITRTSPSHVQCLVARIQPQSAFHLFTGHQVGSN